MELTISGQRRRAAETAKTAPQAGKKPAGIRGGSSKSRTDKADWSQAALSFLQEVNRRDMEERRKLLEAKQRGNGELDALNESLKKMERCQKIASRIMRGDKVPPQDEMYLMDNDPDGYKLALVCRKPKEKPKEWESVLRDEEETASSDSGGETTETTEAAEPSGEAAEG